MYNNHSNGASYGFKAPSIAADAGQRKEVIFPTFEKLTPTLSSNAATVDVVRTTTLVDLGSTALAATCPLEYGAGVAVAEDICGSVKLEPAAFGSCYMREVGANKECVVAFCSLDAQVLRLL